MGIVVLLPLLISIIAGLVLGIRRWESTSSLRVFTAASLALSLATTVYIYAAHGNGLSIKLWDVAGSLSMYFNVDGLGSLLSVVISFVWLMVGIYSLWYMDHKEAKNVFLGVYVAVGGIIPAICYAGNFFTFYVFFELMTLVSAGLVIFEKTPEAIYAAKKYMFYSFAGAFLTLFGFFQLSQAGVQMDFSSPGNKLPGSSEYYLSVFLVIIGFGTKAGIFPMHGWLPTAHPVAPAPASAVLSGAITKMGVVGVIRFTYYVIGVDNLRGTWVQYAWIILSLTTILLGSIMAYREDVLKKRIAFSTVSQVSYVLFGLSLMTESAFTGAMMHMFFHSMIKSALFIIAGIIIVQTGKERVSELSGIGKKMPVTMWCFTAASVALVGIPPTSPFLSKWFIAIGSLETGIKIIDWLGPVVLLISALFTALYLLTISLKAFFDDGRELECKDPKSLALAPVIVFTILAVVLGIWPEPLINAISSVVQAVL